MLDDLIADLKRDEGWRSYAYQDSHPEKYWTIGYGFLVDERKGGGLPKEIGEQWLRLVVADKWAELTARAPWVMDQPQDVQRALANMSYQLGVNGLLRFKNMISALRHGNRAEAAAHALDSAWARQTPSRAIRVTDLIRSGDRGD